MTFQKLDKTQEQSIVTAIEKIIDNSRHNPETDLNKIAADVLTASEGMTPQLAARACEAYNKSKSIYTLQKRASEDRAEDFDLMDSQKVHALMYGYHQKTASASFELPTRTHRDNIPELRRNLEKVAMDDSGIVLPEQDPGVIERDIYRTTTRLECSIDKLKETAGMRKQASEDAIHRACQVMRRMPSKSLHKVARQVVNRYGDDGAKLVSIIGAYIDKELPIKKTANAAIFPLTEPYPSIAIAIDEARAFRNADGMLQKTADYLPDARDPETYQSAVLGTANKAKAGIKKLLDPAINFAKSPIYAQITKDHKVKGDETFDATLRNRLQQLRATQAFVDVAADDFVKGYPIDDTVQAYNNVVSSMPELLDEKYAAWLQSLVREQLVQGNVYDANTIQQLQTIGSEIKKGRVQSIDEATKHLEAGQGGTKEGLDIIDTPAAPAPARAESPKQTASAEDARRNDLKEAELQMQSDAAQAADKTKNRELNIKENQAAKKKPQADKDK